jgi:GGDEF domain-containing protein
VAKYSQIGKRADLPSGHQGILADYTLLPVRRSLAKRFKGPFGEKRRSISGIVIDTDQFKQTKE